MYFYAFLMNIVDARVICEQKAEDVWPSEDIGAALFVDSKQNNLF